MRGLCVSVCPCGKRGWGVNLIATKPQQNCVMLHMFIIGVSYMYINNNGLTLPQLNRWDPWKRHDMESQSHYHDDVIKWKHFPRNWPFVRGIHRSPVNSPHKGQWRGALMFSLICGWINDWANNREAGDLRRYRAHYDVIIMVGLLWRESTGLMMLRLWVFVCY